jgi:hypothetical protein
MKRKLFLAAVAMLGVSVFAISDAQSAPASFSFDLDGTQGVFGPPGTSTLLATHTVDDSLIGRSCQVTADVRNNDSVREGTDLLVESNSVTLTLANVEHAPGVAAPAVLGQLVLGSTVSGSVRFGPEGQASVGATIVVDCPDVPTTTAPPTTTQPIATPAASSVTVLPATVATTGVAVAGVAVVQPSFTG